MSFIIYFYDARARFFPLRRFRRRHWRKWTCVVQLLTICCQDQKNAVRRSERKFSVCECCWWQIRRCPRRFDKLNIFYCTTARFTANHSHSHRRHTSVVIATVEFPFDWILSPKMFWQITCSPYRDHIVPKVFSDVWIWLPLHSVWLWRYMWIVKWSMPTINYFIIHNNQVQLASRTQFTQKRKQFDMVLVATRMQFNHTNVCCGEQEEARGWRHKTE